MDGLKNLFARTRASKELLDGSKCRKIIFVLPLLKHTLHSQVTFLALYSLLIHFEEPVQPLAVQFFRTDYHGNEKYSLFTLCIIFSFCSFVPLESRIIGHQKRLRYLDRSMVFSEAS